MATRVYHSQILRIDEIAPATRVLRLERPPEFEFTPGQFISCLLEIGGDNLTKPYTITSDPETAGHLEICLNQIAGGLASTYLFELQVGASLRFTGPWGTFTLVRAPERESVFIGADTGIAAIRPLLHRAMAAAQAPIAIWQQAESSAHLLFCQELQELTRIHPLAEYHRLTDGSLSARIEQRYVHGDAQRQREFFICGVGEVVTRLRDMLRGAGYERRAVHYERW